MMNFKNLMSICALGAALAVISYPGSGVARQLQDRPGECPYFNATLIDDAAELTGYATLAPEDIFNLQCADDPSVPYIDMKLYSNFPSPSTPATDPFLAVGLKITGDFGAINYSGSSCDNNVSLCSGALTVPQSHVCRAEILKSRTWRRLCR